MKSLYKEKSGQVSLSITFVAKQQTTSLSNKVLDMLLHAQQVLPPNDYICDVLLVRTLVL